MQQSAGNVGLLPRRDEHFGHAARRAPFAPTSAAPEGVTVCLSGAVLAPAPAAAVTGLVAKIEEAPVFVDDSGSRKRLLRIVGVLIGLLSIGFISIVGVALAVPNVATSVGLGDVVPFVVPGAAAPPPPKAPEAPKVQAKPKPKPKPAVVKPKPVVEAPEPKPAPVVEAPVVEAPVVEAPVVEPPVVEPRSSLPSSSLPSSSLPSSSLRLRVRATVRPATRPARPAARPATRPGPDGRPGRPARPATRPGRRVARRARPATRPASRVRPAGSRVRPARPVARPARPAARHRRAASRSRPTRRWPRSTPHSKSYDGVTAGSAVTPSFHVRAGFRILADPAFRRHRTSIPASTGSATPVM